MKTVVIIGAGMGGLAAALRLRHMGFKVSVIEKQKKPGGRSNLLQVHGILRLSVAQFFSIVLLQAA